MRNIANVKINSNFPVKFHNYSLELIQTTIILIPPCSAKKILECVVSFFRLTIPISGNTSSKIKILNKIYAIFIISQISSLYEFDYYSHIVYENYIVQNIIKFAVD